MDNELKDLGFEEIETEETDAELEELGFESELPEESPREKTSPLWALTQGTASGATLDFVDELGAGAATLIDLLAGISAPPSEEDVLKHIAPATKEKITQPVEPVAPEKSVQDLYKEYLQAQRAQQKAAIKDQPLSYLGGAIAGGSIIPMGAAAKGASTAGKIGRGAAAGAAAGGIGTIGAMEDVNTSPQGLYEAGLDVAKGAALGGTIGAAIPAVGKAASSGKKVLGDLDVAKIFKKRAAGENLAKTVQAKTTAVEDLASNISTGLAKTGEGAVYSGIRKAREALDSGDRNAAISILNETKQSVIDLIETSTSQSQIKRAKKLLKDLDDLTQPKPKITMRGQEVVGTEGKPVTLSDKNLKGLETRVKNQNIRTELEEASAQKYKELSGKSPYGFQDQAGANPTVGKQAKFLMKSDPKTDRRGEYQRFMEGFSDPRNVENHLKGLDEINPEYYNEIIENIAPLAEDIRLGKILNRPVFTTAGVGKGIVPALGAGIETGAAHAANFVGMLANGGRSVVSSLGKQAGRVTPDSMKKFADSLSKYGYATLAKPFYEAATSQQASDALVAEMVKADERDDFFNLFGGATEESLDITGAILGTVWNSTFGYEAPASGQTNDLGASVEPQYKQINKAMKYSSTASPEEIAQMSSDIRHGYGKDAEVLATQLDKMAQTDDRYKRNAMSFSILQNPANRKMLGLA